MNFKEHFEKNKKDFCDLKEEVLGENSDQELAEKILIEIRDRAIRMLEWNKINKTSKIKMAIKKLEENVKQLKHYL